MIREADERYNTGMSMHQQIEKLGAPLAPWTYSNPELFELEYEAFFLRRWQFVGHVNEVTGQGDYVTADIGRDNVFVLRGKDDKLRAFLNVCRHRASRVLEGSGSCRGVIRCPYHGWSYQFDGSLLAIPQDTKFPDFDRSAYGLHEVQLDVFHGLMFVRIKGDGPTVTEQFAHTGAWFEKYDVANYVPCAASSTEVWDVNWKVAWDNYLENYHIPVGHPGLNRLLLEDDEFAELPSGVSYGVFLLREKLSTVDVERQYQELFPKADSRLPEEARGKWVQFGLTGSLGLDLYPEMLDLFQLIPLGAEKTLVRASYYGHPDPSPDEVELRRLNVVINDSVNDEDRTLCTRVQQGLRTNGYRPGPLSSMETSVFRFHELVRKLVPVSASYDAPPRGQVEAENRRLCESN